MTFIVFMNNTKKQSDEMHFLKWVVLINDCHDKNNALRSVDNSRTAKQNG